MWGNMWLFHIFSLRVFFLCVCANVAFSALFQMLSFFQGMFTFYHQGHELAKDFNHYKMELQINIQNVRKWKLSLFKKRRLRSSFDFFGIWKAGVLVPENWGYAATFRLVLSIAAALQLMEAQDTAPWRLLFLKTNSFSIIYFSYFPKSHDVVIIKFHIICLISPKLSWDIIDTQHCISRRA